MSSWRTHQHTDTASSWRQRRENLDFPVTSDASRHVVIVGAGIVGACLARLLAERGQHVTIIERGAGGEDDKEDDDETRFPGSTGLAPGFVGQLHTSDTLRDLAQRSVAHYKTIPGAFASVGGMEVASTGSGVTALQERLALAQRTQVKASWLTAKEAIAKEPRLLSEEQGVCGAVWYPDDGTADAGLIAKHELVMAKKQSNVELLYDTEVVRIEPGHVTIAGRQQPIRCNDVVVCSGVWARELIPDVPVYGVAHPYAYSAAHDRPLKTGTTPFLRWPEHKVYARDHGDRFGLGTYDHAPVQADDVADDDGKRPARRARAEWVSTFTATLQASARRVLPSETLAKFAFASVTDDDTQPNNAFNGLFSVTPDGLPLAGLVQGKTVYVCAAVWVTHAYGTAKVIYDQIIRNRVGEEDRRLKQALDPNRFGTLKQDAEKTIETQLAAYKAFLAAKAAKETQLAEREATKLQRGLPRDAYDEHDHRGGQAAAAKLDVAELERRASLDAARGGDGQSNGAEQPCQIREASKQEAHDGRLQERAALEAELLQRALATYNDIYITKK